MLPPLGGRATRAGALSEPVTASGEFVRSDVLTVYAEVYGTVWWTDAEHTTPFLRGRAER